MPDENGAEKSEARLEEMRRTGDAACRIVAELVALIPIPQTLDAARTGASLVDYFKSQAAQLEKMRKALEETTDLLEKICEPRKVDLSVSSASIWVSSIECVRRARAALAGRKEGER